MNKKNSVKPESVKSVNKDPATIRRMFNSISENYDFLNSFLSLYQDKLWRMIAAKKCKLNPNSSVLDVACGTGSLTFELAKYVSGKPGKVIGIDFSKKMIQVANKKLESKNSAKNSAKKRFNHVSFELGDAEHIRFKDNSFDCATIAFGLRNVSNVDLAISEMRRVVKKNGKVAILELSMPKNQILNQIYSFYFLKVISAMGGLISGSKYAYDYLPNSVMKFHNSEEIRLIMEKSGFTNVTIHQLTFGVAYLCIGIKE